MNVKFSLEKCVKDFKPLYVRVYHYKLDLKCPVGMFSLASDWDKENESFNSLDLNLKLSKLKTEILESFNKEYSSGTILNLKWLKSIIHETFNRPIKESGLINNNADIYFTDFGKMWIDKFADKWKVSAKKFMGKTQKGQYNKLIDQVIEFEKSIGSKWVLKDLSLDQLYEFANYLEENEYNSSTIERAVSRVRFFLNRASEQSLKVSRVRTQRVYIEKEDEIDGVFLSDSEINKILNKDFSFDNDLETTKDNFAIAIFSGMRSSDFLENLDISNFREGYIQITTQKTKAKIVVPVHKQVEFVIKKYHGMLPPKQTNADFNKHIKTLCQLCDIDNVMQGKVFDSKKKRKVLGNYPKYKMITAHSLRRSFCSNMRGKISDDSLSKIMGWSTDKLMSLYDKNSKLSHANNLLNVWNKE